MGKATLLAACAASVLGTGAALAQADPGGTVPATTASQPVPATSGLSEIIVTAQRRSENLQRAALAVSAVSGSALVSAGVTRPTELTSVVPALQVAPSSGPYSLFYLRGVGNFNGNALSDAAVAFNFDGVYIGRPSGTTGFFYDVDRVEVLKGPQGTLYGRNATGGAINVISKRPVLDRFEGEGTFEYGNYNAVRFDGAVNVPVGDKVAIRAAGTRVSHDGYMKDDTDDQDDLGGRLSLRAEPTDTLSINLVADVFRQRGAGVGGDPVESGVDHRYGYLSPEGQAFLSQQPNLLLGRTFAPFTLRPYLHNDFWGISSTIDWRTPIGTLTLVPAYREGKLDYLSETAGFYLWQREKDRQTSVEARLDSGNDHPIRYLLGGFYYHETNDVPTFYINQQGNVNYDVYRQTDTSGAAFGRLTWAIVPAVRLSAGGRYTSERKRLDGTLTGAIRTCVAPTSYFPVYTPGCPTASPMPVSLRVAPPDFDPAPDGTLTIPLFVDNTGPNAKRDTFHKFTYRLGADWDVTSRNLLYASYETGFKSGGFFFTSDAGVYRPESIQAWTIGSKNRFLDNRLQLNLEAFYWRYKNQQITHLISDSSGATVFATENVGRASYKGFEAEARYLLTRLTEINVDVQYLDAEYKVFTYQRPNQNGGISNGTSCPNVGAPGTSYTVDCSGKRPPYAPTWTLNLGLQQTVELAGGGRIVGNARAHYQTRTLTGLEFTTPEYQKGYWQVDAQLGYTFPGSRFTVSGFVNNLTDRTVKANTFPVPLGLITSASLRPPRTYGVRVGAKF